MKQSERNLQQPHCGRLSVGVVGRPPVQELRCGLVRAQDNHGLSESIEVNDVSCSKGTQDIN